MPGQPMEDEVMMPDQHERPARSVYERQRQAACTAFKAAYDGSLDALFCVVSFDIPSDPERQALLATAAREGFVAADVIWVTARDLDAPDLATIVESVDPLCLVVTDQRSAEVLSRAYNQPVKLESCDAILGRPCCCFMDFKRMLETDSRKQQAWALLKEMLSCVHIR